MSNKQTRWFLVSNCGMNFPLHQTMISLGKEGCDVVLQSRSVEKRHALITYDHYEKRFKVKDLNSINGTYLNEVRMPSQTFVKLEHLDSLRFGFDVTIYQIQQVAEHFPVPVGPDYRYCSWGARLYPHHSMKMADCQGCLQKQAIQHTCGMKDSDWEANHTPAGGQLRPRECVRPETALPNISQTPQAQTSVGRQDCCGNIVPSTNGLAWETSPTCAQPSYPSPQQQQQQQQHARSNGVAAENGCRVPHIPAFKDGYSPPQQQQSYALPPGQQHSAASPRPCTCAYGEASPRTDSAAKNTAGCSSNTSLQSTFSGDSLDLTADSLQKGGREEKRAAAAAKNVVPAEKPYKCSSASPDAAVRFPAESSSVAVAGRPGCTAFTIEFDDEPSTAKKLDIKDSISKFAPPKPEGETKMGHRKNLSLSKGSKCDNKQAGEGEAVSPTMGLIAATKDKLAKSALSKGGYHSEGHASSDLEDDTSARSDPEKLRLKSAKDHFEVVGLPVKLSLRNMENLASKPNSTIRRSLPVTGLRDSAKYLINKMFGEITAPTNSPTEPISPTVLLALHAENGKPRGCAVVPPPSANKNEGKDGRRGSWNSCTTYTVEALANKAKMDKAAREKDEQTKDIIFSDEEDDSAEEEEEAEESPRMGKRDDCAVNGDNASETGTYTIESDQKDSKEELDARRNIDSVFGVTGEYPTPGGAIERPVVDAEFPEVELRRKVQSSTTKKRSKSASQKGTPGWLKEWVAQTVAEKGGPAPSASESTKLSSVSVKSHSSLQDGSALNLPAEKKAPGFPLAPCAPNEISGQRQRRRLPVPPVERLPPGSPFASLPSDNTAAPLKIASAAASDRLRGSSSSTSPDGRRSDSSMDTETILKDTETVVSAMEARMDHHQHSSVQRQESRYSGGESDVDTSTASGANEANGPPGPRAISKALNAQLVLQLKALESGGGKGSVGQKSRQGSHSYGRNQGFGGGSHGRSTPTGDLGGSYSEVETASIHSDMSSSSDISGSSPASNRKGGSDKAPLMRFNRAFSLRRARLGCESDGASKPGSATTKATVPSASSRPSSASSIGSSKDRPRQHGSASNKSDGGGGSNSFDRSDGGRFSLRLPRSAPVQGRSTTKAASKNASPSSGGRSKAGPGANAPPPNPRCNSTLSSKELEMKNWKRRKEYDPLKAAAEGRKKEAAKKVVPASSMSKSESHSPTQTSFTRSASFHGTDGLGMTRLRSHTFTSDEDSVDALPTALPTDAFGPLHDVGSSSRARKSSEDESTSEAIRAYSHTDLTAETTSRSSPRGSPLLHQVHRHKSKIDALDNLVISTVHQVSCNLRGNAEGILKKLGDVHGEECKQSLGAGGLAGLLERLANADSPELSPQGGGISRQLSGILKNMKRLEESLQAVSKVLDVVPPNRHCPTRLSEDRAPQAMPRTKPKKKVNGHGYCG